MKMPIAESRAPEAISVGFGFIAQLIGQQIPASDLFLTVLRWGLMIIGTAVAIWGCSSFARKKGLNRAWGIVGLISIIGLIILAVMPNKKQPSAVS